MNPHVRTLMAVVLLATLAVLPSRMFRVADATRNAPGNDALEQRGERGEERETPGLQNLFWEQRLAGNPDVDYYAKLADAYGSLRHRPADPLRKSAATPWVEQGPWNIGGRIRGLAMHPSDPNVVYAGAASGGVWKSTDFGNVWFPVTDNAPLLPIGAIAVDPSNPNRVYAGTGEPDDMNGDPGRVNGTPVWFTGNGVLRSDDAGATWRTMTWASKTGAATRIAVHPTSGDTLLVSTLSDLWKSTNGGQNWSRVFSGLFTDVCYKPGQPSTVYAAIAYNRQGVSTTGVYVSDAGGKSFSWRKISTTNFPAPDSCGRIILAVTPADPQRLYAAVLLNQSKLSNPLADFLALMVSTDGGQTWEKKTNAISSSCTNGIGYYAFALAVSPADPNLVFIGGLDVYRSINGGRSFGRMTDWTLDWNSNNSKYVHADSHFFLFRAGDANSLMVGGDGGCSITSDKGLNWTRKCSNLGTVQFYACGYDPSNPTTLVGGTQDNGSLGKFSSDNSQWNELYGGDGGVVAIDPQKNTTRYYVTTTRNPQTQDVMRVIVRTGIGQPAALSSGFGAGPNTDYFNWIAPIYFHPNDRTRLYTATQYVYMMKNPDTPTPPAWQIISPDLGYIVTKLMVAPSNADCMYATSAAGNVWITKNLSAKTPAWTRVTSGLPGKWVTDVCVSRSDENTAWVTISGFGTGHVYKTTNAGQSWTNVTGNLPDIPCNAVVQSPTNESLLFVATDLGVLYTIDDGATWNPWGAGLPNVVVYDMKITPGGTLIAGTHGRGMWTASSILGVDRGGAAPSVCSLGQNYPNPFNPSTQIPYTLSERAMVRLTVYDATGAVVRTLVDGVQDPGSHTAIFDAGMLPSGTYLYELRAGASVHVRGCSALK